MKSRLDAELDRAESAVLERTNPVEAIKLVDRAREHFASIPSDDVHLLLARGRLSLAVSDTAAATSYLEQARSLSRALAPSAPPAQLRLLRGILRDAQHVMVELAVARNDTARAREAMLRLFEISATDRAPRAVLLPVESGVAEVRLAVLDRHLVSWLRVANEESFVVVPIGRDSLASNATRLRRALRGMKGDATHEESARELYRAVFGPHRRLLGAVERVDVYADGVLTELPYGALIDDKGRHLMERFAIRHMVATAAQNGGGKIRSGVPLLIGDPTWKRSDFPELEPLRWAADEVRQIAGVYSESVVVPGGGATREALLRVLPHHRIIHFAGHARIVVENPGVSHLVVAAGSSFGGGVIYASDLASLDLRGVELAVLSACGRTRDDAGGGNALATALLDAGVETVVAGLWEVDDRGAADLMSRFHAHVSRGLTVERALRESIIELISKGVRVTELVPLLAPFAVFSRG
jgi:CHAT domain-containing protein